jgi:hypothetical protein
MALLAAQRNLIALRFKLRWTPGSLRVQRITSKQSDYNLKILKTMLDRTCRMTVDQGGEWARLPRAFADCKTVNHSIKWATPDGISTNLGEAYSGILKELRTTLCIWKGSVPEKELNDRWQELLCQPHI